jgi:hypothetical protein
MRMFRISLRQMLVFVAAIALAIASLKYANDVWLAVVATVLMPALFISLIVAVVDRGPRQAFAIGFAIIIVAYGTTLLTGTSGFGGDLNSKNVEFDQWAGRLPTTRLLRYVHAAVQTSGYFDNVTGKELPNYDPANPPNRFRGVGGFAPGVSYRESPPRGKFMPIGHMWWALLLGYLGGVFAMFVYRRRLRDEEKLPADTR